MVWVWVRCGMGEDVAGVERVIIGARDYGGCEG